eukprot:2777145-Rhodomonas_salina.1
MPSLSTLPKQPHTHPHYPTRTPSLVILSCSTLQTTRRHDPPFPPHQHPNPSSNSSTQAKSVGASGAIFGLVGALGVFLSRHDELLGDSGRSGLSSILQTCVRAPA